MAVGREFLAYSDITFVTGADFRAAAAPLRSTGPSLRNVGAAAAEPRHVDRDAVDVGRGVAELVDERLASSMTSSSRWRAGVAAASSPGRRRTPSPSAPRWEAVCVLTRPAWRTSAARFFGSWRAPP